jgi:hypothetical protein
MKQTLSSYQFADAFRSIRPDNFTYAGLNALFDYFEEYKESCGEEMELDVIAICCDFSEHARAIDCIKDMGYDFEPEGDDDEERQESALGYLRDNTQVIEFDGRVIIQGF